MLFAYDETDKTEYLEFQILLTQLFSSIRDLNRRLNELKGVIKSESCSDEGRRLTVKRIERLNETRMCLIYSVFDLRKKAEKEINTQLTIGTLYKELKNL